MRKSLAKKLIIYFALLNLLSITVVGIFAYTQAKDALISRTFDQLISVRIEKKKRVEDFFQQCKHDIQVISSIEFPLVNNNKQYDTDEGLSQKINNQDIFKKAFSPLITNKQNFESIYVYQSDSNFFSANISNTSIDKQKDILSSEHHLLFQSL